MCVCELSACVYPLQYFYVVTQVDLVKEHTEIKDKIQELLSVEIPKLQLCDVISLEVKG